MPFDYDQLTEQIDLQQDSEAVQNYKAGTGALAGELRQAGWSEEQISNGLRTHFESVSMVLIEHILEHFVQDNPNAWCVASEAAAEIHPRSISCSHVCCAVRHPGEAPE